MSRFIESLKRLYQEKKAITKEKVDALFESKKIQTEEEYNYILGV